jgi:two-component system CheB/CheR fusion protein
VHTTPESLADVIRSQSALPVRTVRDRAQLRSGTVFVVAGEQTAEVEGNLIRSTARRSHRSGVPDHLIASAACSFGDRLITVILPETDAPTAALTQQVKEHGGTVLLATSDSGATGGPLPLIPTTVDVTADLDEIAVALQSIVAQADAHDSMAPHSPEPSPIDATHDPHDFEFFRDPELFGYLRETILPDLVARARSRGAELRLWSAGCATGEEAYSLAILLAEVLGEELDRFTVRLFATDLDEEAVQFARRGIYPQAALGAVSPERLAQYFVKTDGAYEVSKRIRAMIIFGQHDLGARAPFPRIDLVLCRNVLIYFTPELQRRALQLFAFSLRDGGVLVLGKAETANTLPELFALQHQQLKVYRRYGERVLIPPGRMSEPPLGYVRPTTRRQAAGINLARTHRDVAALRPGAARSESALVHLPIGVLTINRRYDIQSINNAARMLLAIHGPAIGEDLIHLVHETIARPLRTLIDATFHAPQGDIVHDVVVGDVRGQASAVDVTCQAIPHEADDGDGGTVLVIVADVTPLVEERRRQETENLRQRGEIERLQVQLQQLNQANVNLMEANEELATTNTQLRATNEEFLVGNEELQAASEEVETLNEELQATNEELETLNEELQATVEELKTTTDDLQARSSEMTELAAEREAQRIASESQRQHLATILEHIDYAVAAIDVSGAILTNNTAYNRIFGSMGERVVLEDEDGTALGPDADPRRRLLRGAPFTMRFAIRDGAGQRRLFEASGQRATGADIRDGGVLIVREVASE